MGWVLFFVVVAAIGGVPGMILGPRLLTLMIAVAVVIAYAAGMIRLGTWAASCWDCRYEMGFTEQVFQRRADAFWQGFELFSLFIGSILAGLLLGAMLRHYVNLRMNPD